MRLRLLSFFPRVAFPGGMLIAALAVFATAARAATFPGLTGVVRSSHSVLTAGSPLVLHFSYTIGTDPVVSVQIQVGSRPLAATAVASGTALSFDTTSFTDGDYALNSVTLVDLAGRRATYTRDGVLFNMTQVAGETSLPLGVHTLNLKLVDFHYGGPVATLPSILNSPAPVTVAAGGTADFGALFGGTPPLSYQWSKNGSPIADATNSALTLRYVQPADAGVYSISARNSAGGATTAGANLVVTSSAQAPSFISPPANATAGDGGNFSVSAQVSSPGGANVTWLALLRGRALAPVGVTSTNAGAVVNASLAFGPVALEDAGAFQLMATNSAGSTFSPVRTLTVLAVPVITTQPAAQAVPGGARAILSVAATGTGSLTYQWSKGGVVIAGATGATLEMAAFQLGDVGSYTVVVTDQNGSRTSHPAELTLAVPSMVAIITSPASQSAAAGTGATFAVAASGTGPLTYQWTKDGTAISGASAAILVLPTIGALDAATYAVRVSNALGSVTSSGATLTVTGAAPVIVAAPVGQTPRSGTEVSFAVVAAGSGPLGYQWFRNSVPLAGATGASLLLSRVLPAMAGDYTVRVSNTAGSVLSAAARLDLADPSRLVNLSLLTPLGADEAFALGFVIGGEGATGTKPLLVRVVGPTLGIFGVVGAHSDPRLQLFNAASVPVGENNDWGGDPALAALFTQVGAFAFGSSLSKDSALSAPALPTGSSSVRVSGDGAAAGIVLVELYETTLAAAVTTATPRLVNVSVLKKIASGITAGFVVGGVGPCKLLVRAVGPTLATVFGVPDATTDPSLSLHDASGATLGSNDNWNTADTSAMRSVGAFDLAAGGKDAALIASLLPGSYTIQVKATGENSAGSALVEIYEVP